MTCAESTHSDQMSYPIENIGVRSDNEGTQGAQSPDSHSPVLTRSDTKDTLEKFAVDTRALCQRQALEMLEVYRENQIMKRDLAIEADLSPDPFNQRIIAAAEITKMFKDYPL